MRVRGQLLLIANIRAVDFNSDLIARKAVGGGDRHFVSTHA
jgi:hypothetical protein